MWVTFQQRTAASWEAAQERGVLASAQERGVLEEANATSEQAQVKREDQLVDAAEDGLPKEEHVPSLGSQPFSGSFDADLLKLLCNENLKALSQGDGSSDWKSIAAEACSKLDSQDALSLDKIVLGTPPDLLVSFLLYHPHSRIHQKYHPSVLIYHFFIENFMVSTGFF